MPVGAYAGANVSNGNGVTTLFPYNFKILDQTHIEVKVDGVLKVLGADYTVTGVGLSNGGNVVFGVAPANGAVVQRARKVPYTRAQDYQNNGDFKENTVDSDFDLIEMQVQQLAADARARSRRRSRSPPTRWHQALQSTTSCAASRLSATVGAVFITGTLSRSRPMTAARCCNSTSAAPAASRSCSRGEPMKIFRALLAITLLAVFNAAAQVPLQSLNPRAFGAKCDGSTDDSGAFQKAHDALPSDGGEIVVPRAANCLINSTVAFTKSVSLRGNEYYSSELVTTGNAVTIFTTTKKLLVSHIGFTAVGAAAGTAIAIKTLSSATSHSDTLLIDNYFQGFARAYWSQRTAALRVVHNRFAPGGSGRYGLYLENLSNSDEGDSFIDSNYFSNTLGETSVLVASTSGIVFTGNKFNGAAAVHVDIAPTSNNVGNYLFSNNSFEGESTAAIRLIATTGVITKTLITGNQFSSGGATHVIVGSKAQNTVITGNTFNDINAANGIGVEIQAGALSTTIVGNQFHQLLTAIKSDSSISGQTIKDNRFYLRNTGSSNVTNFYLGGENDQNLSGMDSEKDFEVDRFITNSSNAVYVNAFQLKGNCIVEVFVTGIVQGAGTNSMKYRKVLVTNDGATITDLIALVAVGAVFDLQVVQSGGFVVIGIKRNGATGTSTDMQVRVRVTGYVRDFSKV
jgi:hypothetical protein